MGLTSAQIDPVVSGILKRSYEHYNRTLLEKDGRTLADPDKGDIDKDGNTSEKVTYSEARSEGLRP